jgi:predicted amidohydrolase YtcJ
VEIRPWRRLALNVATLVAIVACSPMASGTPTLPAGASESTLPLPTPIAASPSTSPVGRVILVGRVDTMAESGVVEAVALEDGRVSAVGNRDEVLALADDDTRVIELGDNVAYPGFIDAHSHWIGDREHYGGGSAQDAMAAALRRGWTSIAELWVNEDRLAELEALDSAGLPIRVDAYLAANHPAPDGTHLGEWYLERQPGAVSDRLRVQGVKFTLDNGWGSQVWWEPDELAANVERAHDAGWQIAIHTVSSDAHAMVLDAFDGALDGAPNAAHHRIEHAIQVTDEQLARMAELDIVTVMHPDGGASDWVLESDYLGNLGGDTAVLARWRDFVDAGLHVAAGVDAPWVFPDLALTDSIGRPFDQIAGGMDGRGRANPETPAWVLDQLLTAEQGLKAVTLDAAWALDDEANRGQLAPGAYADVTILSRDVTLGSPDEIRAAQVVATIVGGRTAFCGEPAFCP